MKILYIDPMSRNNLGLYDKNLLENIKGDIYFFASKGLQFEEITNIRIIFNYDYYEKNFLLLRIISYIHSQIKLLIWIINNNPDIIHFQWIKLPIFDLLILLIIKLRYKKSKVVYTAHNLLPHDMGIKFYLYFIYYILYRLFDGIIVHADCTSNDLIKIFHIKKPKIKVIPHGVLKSQLGVIENNQYPDKIVFSLTGLMDYYKGVDILIDAWVSNKNLIENDAIHLILAGSGNIPLEKIPIHSNITVINRFLTNEEYEAVINSTDIGILPYRKISQSGVLLSLLAQHKAVIVSDCGGLTQPFELGKVGWILTELSSKTLSETINNIIQNKNLLLEIKNDEMLWKKIDIFYSWEVIGKSTVGFYNDLSGK